MKGDVNRAGKGKKAFDWAAMIPVLGVLAALIGLLDLLVLNG